ncbi:MAG: hypothetical protein ACTHK7_17745 [Aureliella sp.]
MLSDPAVAQQAAPAPAQPSKTEQELTEGLLDLLTEPSKESTKPSTEPKENADERAMPAAPTTPDGEPAGRAPSAAPPISSGRGMGAKDRGTGDLGDGEDIGAAGTNPLAEVRLGMLTAAGWLRDQSEVDKTEQLQRDIVARLDQLIDDLSQQPPAGSPPPPKDSQTQSPNQPQPKPAQDGSSQKGEGQERIRQQQAQRDAASGGETQADASGTEGQPAPGELNGKGVVVDLNDPTALQRSAWGNLPDRVREQMQSRMVERFLPGYREQIEAYYRALSR